MQCEHTGWVVVLDGVDECAISGVERGVCDDVDRSPQPVGVCPLQVVGERKADSVQRRWCVMSPTLRARLRVVALEYRRQTLNRPRLEGHVAVARASALTGRTQRLLVRRKPLSETRQV